MTGRPARDRPATAATRWPAGPVPVPVGDGKTSQSRPTPATPPCDTARATDAPATTPAGATAPGVPGRPGVDVLLRQRPRLAAAGLGLGVAAVSEPFLTPAGPAEASAAASMPLHRRREFLAGRYAARRALRAVGLDCGEIPRSGRLPVFPPGRAASISHSAGVAVAVARAPGRDTPLGCDLELRPLPPGAVRLVLREDEEGLLNAGPWSVTALFSAKEAAWKALHGPDGTRAAGPSGSLRDLRARPSWDGLRIEPRAGAARAVRVRVVPVGWGVFSYVTGWSAA
ncbi:4'-phosphopantetheinyl transferase superfamily protein [Streptomyces griseoloalbus]|uniref:4'-phosphopantetheinyl transferase superfamily protein n=1 Tax=Streptomyces griseoloalbus TaxID=67303 RepID=A0ABV3EBQ1_9ACTN